VRYTELAADQFRDFLEDLSVMARIVVIAALGAMVMGCSASSRVENILPEWANNPPRQATPQQQERRDQGGGKRAVKPQEQANPAPQGAVLEE